MRNRESRKTPVKPRIVEWLWICSSQTVYGLTARTSNPLPKAGQDCPALVISGAKAAAPGDGHTAQIAATA